MNTVTVRLYEIVGNSFCVAAEDGQKVYSYIKAALTEEKKVVISFKNVEMVTTAFLNTAIGQLYNKEFDYEFLKSSFSLEDADSDDIQSLKRVIDTAKLYYSDPDRLNESIRKVMEG